MNNIDIESRVKSIIARIMASPMPDDEKINLYQTISAGLHDLVWPTFVIHMPDDQLKKLEQSPTFNEHDYEELLVQTATQTDAFPELEKIMCQYLDIIDTELMTLSL